MTTGEAPHVPGVSRATPAGTVDASSASMTSKESAGADGREDQHEGGAFELLLAGDVMTGRGIDQILPRPSSPELFEDHLRDARDYVALAEVQSGKIPRSVPFTYPWGDALEELERSDVCIVNLETSVTRSGAAWPDKGINYRMHPGNVPCLTSARIDIAGLANNHMLDWGREGLIETIDTLHAAGIETAGAGRNLSEAAAVTVTDIDEQSRVVVVAVAGPGCGVPLAWAATAEQPGVALLRRLDERAADALAERILRVRRRVDVVVVSIHWGSNWGYDVDDEHVSFAHALVERGVDVVFGHSSHHPRPIELVRGKPVFYGAGDLLNDYEGITGYESFRNDLVLLYSLRCSQGPRATRERPGDGPEREREPSRIVVTMKPFRIRKMRLERATSTDGRWLAEVLANESRRYGTDIVMGAAGVLEAHARRDGARTMRRPAPRPVRGHPAPGRGVLPSGRPRAPSDTRADRTRPRST